MNVSMMLPLLYVNHETMIQHLPCISKPFSNLHGCSITPNCVSVQVTPSSLCTILSNIVHSLLRDFFLACAWLSSKLPKATKLTCIKVCS